MRAPRFPAAVALAAIALISFYSAFTTYGVITSNAPATVPFPQGTSSLDIMYCNSQTMDLYLPSAAARPLPVAIFVHGGGLTAGDKTDVNGSSSTPLPRVFLDDLASAGFAVASVNYRLAPQYKFPAQIEDVKCAIRFIRSHAQQYAINGSEVFVFGTSSGGELATLAALTGGRSTWDVGPYLNYSSAVAAAVDMFGPANVTEWGGYDGLRIFGNNQTLYPLASPTHFVAPGAPPILIIQGLNDTQVPQSQSVELYNKLTAAGDTTQLVTVQNMGHWFAQVGSAPISPSVSQLAQDVVTFFGKYRSGG